MKNKFKMIGQTAHGQADMCGTCRNSHRQRSAHSNESFTVCRVTEKLIEGRVAECSSYEDVRLPTLMSMNQIAWRVASDKQNRKAGFLSPADYRKKKKADGDADESDNALQLPDGSTWWG